MEKRETQKLICPSGKEAELKTYLTARELDQVKQELIGDDRLTVEKAAGAQDYSANGLIKGQQILVKIAVVSYDNSAENCFERLYDGKPEDYDYVSTEAAKMMQANLKKN